MNQISKEALEFLTEAKEQLTKNPEYFTYRDKEANFIALRTGMFDDCIMIYELGNEIGNFTGQLPRQHKILIDYDLTEKYKKLVERMEGAVEKSESLININSDVDYNKGFSAALKQVLIQIKQIKDGK